MTRFVDIVHTAPPGGDSSSSFVEVEDEDGRSMKLGEWVERQDGTWALRVYRHHFEVAMPEPPLERCWPDTGAPCGREGCPEACEPERRGRP
jgi:hypothetical protein